MSLLFKRLAFFVCATLLVSGCQKPDTLENDSLPPEELEPLAWMIGTWQDDEGDIEVHYSWKWGLEQSFMIQDFSMKASDDRPLSGWQVLGWDPAEKRIRSWIFDSDGGFGESDWNLDVDTWYVSTVYTTADGVKGSATYVYKILDANTYLFSTQSGDLGGDFIPNSGPYKFVRKS